MTKTFRDLGVHGALCDALQQQDIIHPFPIQELTLPLALDGNDLIGQARTGTGKTLAFGLPLLQRIDPSTRQTQALVIAPTRELANQVHEDLSIGSALGLTSAVVYGGTPYEEQIEALQGGAHVVVGTPGRLLDHLNRGNLDLSKVTQLVLDEADEMLDMGFLPDVERLIEACQGEDRHTMLFSATMPTAIVRLARRYMHHPTFSRADHEEKHTAPLVTQHFFQVHRMDKPRVLARILQSPERGGVYVFVRTKHMADRLVNELEQLGIPAIPIHGDLRQTSREKNLERFRSGKATVLVATEVAARGLDVSGVTHVVNYDCPDDEKMYLHRIGRTARAGEAGVAVTFAEFNEADRLNVIRKAVGATDTEVVPIFSTSSELVELFDLPEEKPWDAQVKQKVDEEREHQQRRKGGRGDRPSRSSDRPGDTPSRGSGTGGGSRSGSGSRGGRSDGRPKNGRDREGRGEQHSGRSPSADRGRGPDEKERPTSSGKQRARTRTRTRADGAETQATRSRDDGREAGESRRDTGSPRPTSGGTERDRSSGGQRTRARGNRSRGGSGTERRRNDTERSGDRTRAKGGSTDPSASGTSRSRGGADRSGADSSGADRGGRKGGNKGSNNKGGGKRAGSGRSGSRSGGKRSGGNDADRDPTISLARRGPEARGEGQPQLARRVRVDKLP